MIKKIKNLLKNKNFWIGLIYSFVLIFSILFSYGKGFVDGLLIDNEIRQDIIDTTTDFDLSNNDIKTEKKSLIDNGNYNYTFTNEDFLCLGHVSIGGDVSYYFGVEFVTTYNIFYDNYYYTDTFLLNYVQFDYYVVTINILNDTFLNNKTYYTVDGSSTPYRSNAFSGTWRHISGLEYSSFYANSYLTAIFNGGEPTGDIGTVTYINNDSSYLYDTNYQYSDYYADTILYFYSQPGFFPSYYFYWIFSQQLYTCENNLQNKAIINVSMFQNLFAVFDINYGGISDEEYQEAIDTAYQNGVNYGINKGKEIRDQEYLQTQSFFDRMWTFIQTATEKTLAIFNINILPGIPLYFLIVIPIVIGLIGWLFKLLQR